MFNFHIILICLISDRNISIAVHLARIICCNHREVTNMFVYTLEDVGDMLKFIFFALLTAMIAVMIGGEHGFVWGLQMIGLFILFFFLNAICSLFVFVEAGVYGFCGLIVLWHDHNVNMHAILWILSWIAIIAIVELLVHFLMPAYYLYAIAMTGISMYIVYSNYIYRADNLFSRIILFTIFILLNISIRFLGNIDAVYHMQNSELLEYIKICIEDFIRSIRDKLVGANNFEECNHANSKSYNYDPNMTNNYQSQNNNKTNYRTKDSTVYTQSATKFDFFAGCTDKKSIEKKYHQLSKIYHPDAEFGDKTAMAQINLEYEKKMRQIKKQA